jgi:hypothetical protein
VFGKSIHKTQWHSLQQRRPFPDGAALRSFLMRQPEPCMKELVSSAHPLLPPRVSQVLGFLFLRASVLSIVAFILCDAVVHR